MEGGRKEETKPLTRDRSTSVPNNAVIDGEGGEGCLVGWLPYDTAQDGTGTDYHQLTNPTMTGGDTVAQVSN